MAASLAVNKTTKQAEVCAGGANQTAGAHWKKFTHTPDNPYTVGGDACDLAALFAKGQILAVMLPPVTADGACIPRFDEAGKKMMLYTAPGTQSTAVSRVAAIVVGYVLGY